MVKADAVLAKLPAEIDFLLVDDGGEVKEADVEILDEASGFEDAVERGLERFGKPIVLHANRSQFFVGNDHSTHHHDAGGNRREFAVQSRKFLAGIHGLNEKRFEFLARALRFGKRKYTLMCTRCRTPLLILVLFMR